MIDKILESTIGALSRLGTRVQKWADSRSDLRLAKDLSCTNSLSFTQDFLGEHTRQWAEHLEQFKGRPGAAALEIGSHEGRSALWLLDNVLTATDSTITCIDTFEGRGIEPRFDHNVRMAGHSARVTKIKQDSTTALPELDGRRFAIIYIDGDHRAASVLFDAYLSWRLLVPGGVMIFDDYEWGGDRPVERRPKIAIDLFLEAEAGRIEVLHREWQVIVRKRPGESVQ